MDLHHWAGVGTISLKFSSAVFVCYHTEELELGKAMEQPSPSACFFLSIHCQWAFLQKPPFSKMKDGFHNLVVFLLFLPLYKLHVHSVSTSPIAKILH